jgi:hypothetical protein
MRKLFLILPVTAVLLVASVLFGDLGRSLANTEIPDSELANASAPATNTTPAEVSKEDWTETGRKDPVVKSNFKKPNEPYPPGSRRTPPPGAKRK